MKKKNKIRDSWFLEGSSRYGDFPVYRFEVVKKIIEKKDALKILKRNSVAAKDVAFSKTKRSVSVWRIATQVIAKSLNLPVNYYKEHPSTNEGHVYVIFNCDFKGIGEEMHKNVIFFAKQGFKKIPEKKIEESLKKIERSIPDSINRRYIKEAEKRDIPHIMLSRGPAILQLGYGSRLKKTWSALTSNTSRIGAKLTSNKFVLNKLLKNIDIPVPISEVIKKESELAEFLKKVSLPIVIKPIDSTVGRGVNMNVNDLKQAKEAYKKALRISKNVMAEEQIKGSYYRVTFINGKMIACAKALPVCLTGDGRKTLKELVEVENKKPYRQDQDKNKAFYKIIINEKIRGIIYSQGYNLKNVIKKGEKAYLSFSGADGGEWIEDNKSVHPENIGLIQRALRFAELDIAGVDILSPDISKPFVENNGKILEINAGPDVNLHANVSKGKKIIIEKHIINSLFFKNNNGRIPIISITGTNGKTTTAKLLAYILNNQKKHNVGLTTSADKFINGKCVKRGDMSGAVSARSLLINPEIDIAILETCHILGIDRKGLGYDWSDASIITNLTEDHLETYCTKTISDLFKIKSVVARRTKKSGYLILNADDPRVVKMAEYTKANVVYFSLNHLNRHIKKNIKKGLPVYYSKGGYLWEEKNKKKARIILINKIPITHEGKADFNIANCLGAIATVRLIFDNVISLEEIRKKLSLFGSDLKHNPGRFNIIRKRNFKVVVDYAHNVDGYEKTISLVKKIRHKRLVGVIKVAGDRKTSVIKKIGEIAGINFDYIYIKAPSKEKLRGANRGKVCNLLEEGVLISGFDKNKIRIIFNEEDAIKKSLNKAEKGDLVLIFSHDIEKTIKIVENY